MNKQTPANSQFLNQRKSNIFEIREPSKISPKNPINPHRIRYPISKSCKISHKIEEFS